MYFNIYSLFYKFNAYQYNIYYIMCVSHLYSIYKIYSIEIYIVALVLSIIVMIIYIIGYSIYNIGRIHLSILNFIHAILCHCKKIFADASIFWNTLCVHTYVVDYTVSSLYIWIINNIILLGCFKGGWRW